MYNLIAKNKEIEAFEKLEKKTLRVYLSVMRGIDS